MSPATTGHRPHGDRVALSAAGSAVLVVGTAVVSAGVLALLPRIAGWALELAWVPFAGPLRLFHDLAGHVAWWVVALVGLVIGAVVGLALVGETVVVTVDEREIVVVEGRRRSRLARAEVARVVLEGHRLSLRDDRDVDLLSKKIDGDPETLAAALRRHGWPTSP